MLNEDNKKELIKALTEKVKSFECPMCHNRSFTIVDGYIVQSIQNDMNNIILGNGPIIPSMAIVCNNCGFMSQHNLGILGLLKKGQ